MHKHLLIAVLAAGIAAAGCGGPAARPIVNEGVWGQASTGDVFDACVRVLHTRGYFSQAVSRDAGVISTDWQTFPVKELGEGVRGRYKMNILIYTGEGKKTTLSINIRGAWDAPAQAEVTARRIEPYINNRAGSDVKELFDDIGKIVGAPAFTSTFKLSVE